jgi:replicative DNA helicase
MVQDKAIARKILEGLKGLKLQDPLHQRVADIVKGLLERNREVSEAQVMSHLEDKDSIRKLVDIFQQEMEYDNIDTFLSDCLYQVEKGILDKQRQEMLDEIAAMEQKGKTDSDKYKTLLKELHQLNHRLSTDR